MLPRDLPTRIIKYSLPPWRTQATGRSAVQCQLHACPGLQHSAIRPFGRPSESISSAGEGGGLGFYFKCRSQELARSIQWKRVGEGHFVCGMEPATNLVTARDKARAAGELHYLEPGEKREYHLEIGVLASGEEIQQMEKEIPKALRVN